MDQLSVKADYLEKYSYTVGVNLAVWHFKSWSLRTTLIIFLGLTGQGIMDFNVKASTIEFTLQFH